MDYVLFGMGYGASLMLLGWALRTFGPQLKYSRPPLEEDVDLKVEQRFWTRFIQGLGGVVAIAGTTMVLMTFVVVLVNPDDETGGMIAMAIWAFILVALVLWCVMYVRHYGLTGVWTRSEGYGLRRSSGSQPRSRSAESSGVARVLPTRGPNRITDVVTITPEAVETGTSDPEDASAGPIEISPGGEAEPAAEEPRVEDPDSAIYDFGDTADTTVPSDAGGRSEALRRLRERQARARRSSN